MLAALAGSYFSHPQTFEVFNAIAHTLSRARMAARIMQLSDDEISEAIRVRAESQTLDEAAGKLGMTRHAVTRRLLRAAQRGLDGSVPKPLPLGQILRGVSTLYGADGETKLQWVKTKDEQNLVDYTNAIREAFETYKGKSDASLIPVLVKSDSSLLSVYPIADAHIGMMGWGKETGENTDLDLGVQRLRTCTRRLVDQSPPSKEALLLNLGDYQHTDDQRNVTPGHGHQLDTDSRYYKVLLTGVQLEIELADIALQKHEHVTIRNLPGNHDPMASIALTIALAAFYANNPRVTVDMTPSEFFFRRFGATLIGATHGHKTKPPAMAMAMAVNRREDWGATKYHWFLFGHIHHETAVEIGDVRCESFQTLAAKDAFSASHGYVAGQSMQAVTLHIEDGEIGRHRVNVPPPVAPA